MSFFSFIVSKLKCTYFKSYTLIVDPSTVKWISLLLALNVGEGEVALTLSLLCWKSVHRMTITIAKKSSNSPRETNDEDTGTGAEDGSSIE